MTHLLGLPAVVGTTLVFGVLRKELALILLTQPLGTGNVSAALSSTQILVFAIFITFYSLRLATLVALAKEIGKKMTALATTYTFVLATLMGLVARLVLTPLLPR